MERLVRVAGTHRLIDELISQPRPRKTSKAALAQLAVLIAFSWTVVGEATAQNVGGAILLKNDRLMVGRVEARGNLYTVEIAENSKVSIPKDQVRFLAASPEAAYQFKVDATKRWDIGDHFQLTRWCLLNDLVDQAVLHYQEVTKISANHPRVKQLGIELRKKLLEQPDFRDYLGLSPSPTETLSADEPERDARINASEISSNSVVQARADLDQTALHPEIATTFTKSIQPILINRCSQAACHGVQSQNELMLIEPYDRAHARISSQNLRSVLRHVSSSDGQISPLLKYATTAHGLHPEPAISLTESQLLIEIRDWIQRVQDPVVFAGNANGKNRSATAPENNRSRPLQSRPFVPYSPAVALYPVTAGENSLRPVPRTETGGQRGNPPTGRRPGDTATTGSFPGGDRPSMSEIDALDQQAKQILGEIPGRQVNPGPQSQSSPQGKSGNRQDPFDPEEFNRQQPK